MTPARRAWYDLMVADEVRNSAYKKALAMYAPGRTVVDVGAGLGHLSLWALEAGARQVISIEVDAEAMQATRDRLPPQTRDVGKSEVACLEMVSFDVGVGWESDIVVAEIFDSSGVGEGAIETLKDARRFLRPGGIMIPDWMRLHLCLLYRGGPALGSPGKLATVDFAAMPPEDAAVYASAPWFDWCPGEEVGVHVQRSGDVYGFGLAFTLGLAPGVTLTNLPGHPATHWGQGALSFRGPLYAEQGSIWIVRGEVDHSRDRLSPDVSFTVARIEGP